MAVRGRKPKPAALRRLEGNPGKRAIVDGPEFSSGDGVLSPPAKWPAKGPERLEWGRIVPELVTLGIARAVHQAPLESICELYATAKECYERRDFTGHRMAVEAHRKAMNEFGLTPASAGRVGGGVRGDEDEETTDFFGGPKAVEG